MADHATNSLAVGLAMLHAVLGAAHLARRYHLHRAGDLLRVLHAADLVLNFFTDCHGPYPSS